MQRLHFLFYGKEDAGNMSAIIISGGTADREFVKDQLEEARTQAEKKGESCYIIAADKGVECCIDLGVVPDHIVGDFDSITPEKKQQMESMDTQITYLNPEKDDTDSEAALQIAFAESEGNIYFVGSTGTRLDHVMGNISILGQGPQHGRRIWLIDPHNKCYMLTAEPMHPACAVIRREKQFGKYVSVVALNGMAKGVTLEGLKYQLEDYDLPGFTSLGISNEVVDSAAKIRVKEGSLLVIEARD